MNEPLNGAEVWKWLLLLLARSMRLFGTGASVLKAWKMEF